MKILVIGGSYFYGRVFVMKYAGEHNITVANRGTYSMSQFGVRQITGDRRDEALWKQCVEDYDVIVDFCAYEKGDVQGVLNRMKGRTGQYILISTVDVYRRGTGEIKKEDAPFEKRSFPGDAGKYIQGKVALEEELKEAFARTDVHYTALRPAILYGPYNYAPREALFIRLAVQNRLLPRIADAEGGFQLVYVEDAARAIEKCLLNEKAYGQAYNLCEETIWNYGLFADMLNKAAGEELQEIPLTVSQAQERGFPLPFPVYREETELYSNEKSVRDLGVIYTKPAEGMAKTYAAFEGVYKG